MKIDIERIKNSVDIVDVISGYVDIKKQGANHFGCCPFHTENSSSFSVSQNKQFYYCFGCGATGDAVKFLQEYLAVDFVEAVKIIDSNAFDDDAPSNYVKKVRIQLPLNQQKQESAGDILAKCKSLNGHYFSGKCQMLPMINITGELLSLAMIENEYTDIKFLNKSFMFGSCFVFGELSEFVVLTTNYWQALRVNRDFGVCAICVFDPLNFYFIVNDLKRLNIEPALLCNDREDFIQAEKLHIYDVFNKEFGVKVSVESYLNKQQ